MPEVITLGSALIDIFLVLDSAEHVSANKEKATLSFSFGRKIPMDNYEFHVGGNAANVAVGMSRLGVSTAIMAELGNDEFADTIMHTLHREGVNTRNVLHSDTQTSLGVNLQYNGERTILTKHHKRSHLFAVDKIDTPWLYVTSLGESWKQVYRMVISHAHKHPSLAIVFNPGSRQLHDDLTILFSMLEVSAIFIANKEEYIHLLYGKDSSKDIAIASLLQQMQQRGGKICVLTDGVNGAYVLTEEGMLYHAGIIISPPTGKTGAGDAFSSGFLSEYIKTKDIPASLRMGNANAASVVSHLGAQTGLIKKTQLSHWKKKKESITLTEKKVEKK